ncbi:MAG: serine hydroxymethyltransferase, partial [bacterium]|nr:serine hydroxymethyltransferase [bacterium]
MNDKEIKQLIEGEKKRQKEVISLIASENYVSQDVLKALGSELTNKYAEGYPGKRYYGGQTFTDKIELLAQKRALKLFKLSPTKWHVNVQPLSGSPANVAVYTAIVPQGGKIMGMSLDNGGHLTHGHKVSITGKFWVQVPFGVHQKTEVLDYEEIKRIAKENKPNLIVAGFTAYPRKIDFKKFKEIADSCGAMLMVDMSHFAGLVAGGAYPSPFEYADVVTTTVHKTLRGPRSAIIFSRRDVTLPNAKGEQKSISDLIDRAVFPG